MNILSESILIESKSARDSQLINISQERAVEILHKLKTLYFALWQGQSFVTTQQVAEFYEVPPENIRQLLKTYKPELLSDGVKTLRGKDLKDVRDLLSLTSKIANLTVWTPRSVMRVGMTMKNSPIATAMRTSLLNAVEKVIPAQAQEMERMKLELELMRAKQRYQESGQSILAATSPAMLAYLRGDGPPPVKVEYRERFIDANTGQAIASVEGKSLTQLIADAGLNPKSTRDRSRVKNILRRQGWDYDSGRGWASTAYLREFKVLPDEVYEQALRTVLAEIATNTEQPNLFVYQFQRDSLLPPSQT